MKKEVELFNFITKNNYTDSDYWWIKNALYDNDFNIQSYDPDITAIIKNFNNYPEVFRFIREFKDKINWVSISKYQTLSEDFIREFKDEVKWSWISIDQKLSEDFIREFKSFVIWSWISKYQNLSEDFIREFKDYVDWSNISKYQKLSEPFVIEFKDKVNPYFILQNELISLSLKSMELIDKLKNKYIKK